MNDLEFSSYVYLVTVCQTYHTPLSLKVIYIRDNFGSQQVIIIVSKLSQAFFTKNPKDNISQSQAWMNETFTGNKVDGLLLGRRDVSRPNPWRLPARKRYLGNRPETYCHRSFLFSNIIETLAQIKVPEHRLL